jgi:rod shape-determining protein MreC
MLEITSRQRPVTLLAIVVAAQILLLAFQVKREHDVRLVRYWAVQLLTPLQRAGTWVISGTRGNWQHYIDLRHTREENDHLRSELGRLQLRNRELESSTAEAQRLAVLLSFREAHPEAPMLAAQVIGANADASGRTIFINRGEHDHLRRNLAVVTPDGVVGKIVEVYPSTSQVLLLTDRESGVGALFAETRTHGVVKGTSEPLVHMEYVVNDEKVHPDEEVLTSGEDRIFPKDLPIGTVESTKPGNPFQQIRVKPAARLDRLEEVLVLLTSQELNPRKEAEAATAASPSANKPPLPQR